jgi:hypothetical protein
MFIHKDPKARGASFLNSGIWGGGKLAVYLGSYGNSLLQKLHVPIIFNVTLWGQGGVTEQLLKLAEQ